jgi:hypothetical protein
MSLIMGQKLILSILVKQHAYLAAPQSTHRATIKSLINYVWLHVLLTWLIRPDFFSNYMGPSFAFVSHREKPTLESSMAPHGFPSIFRPPTVHAIASPSSNVQPGTQAAPNPAGCQVLLTWQSYSISIGQISALEPHDLQS